MKKAKKGNPVNLIMLRHIIGIKGVKKSAIVKALDTTYLTLQRKLAGETEFTLWEANTLTEVLRLSTVERDAIFFGDLQ